LTDFTVHPRWERFPSLGALIAPHEDIAKIALSRGYPADRLYSLGIPIHPKYKMRRSKEEAKRLLGFPSDERIVLLMGGSMAYGATAKYVKEADKASLPFRILSVSGRNKKKFKKIANLKTRHPLTAIGFSDQVELLMDAADLLVTKPGGLSSAEALSRGLPMILTEPIPGHEVRNEEFLLSHGAALSLSHPRELAPLIDRLFEDEEQLESLARAALALGRPEAAAETVDLAHRLRASGKEGSPLPETAP
jgi:processive 1,2-diacylglycerol beta-glucosyltransferase